MPFCPPFYCFFKKYMFNILLNLLVNLDFTVLGSEWQTGCFNLLLNLRPVLWETALIMCAESSFM